jgi:hypothetical protein
MAWANHGTKRICSIKLDMSCGRIYDVRCARCNDCCLTLWLFAHAAEILAICLVVKLERTSVGMGLTTLDEARDAAAVL